MNEELSMKISSIFLAAVMVSAMAGQSAEARDHHGWRNQHKAWHNYRKQIQKQQKWNHRFYNQAYRYNGWNSVGRPSGRPWDNAYDNAMRAEAAIRAEQQARRGFFWY